MNLAISFHHMTSDVNQVGPTHLNLNWITQHIIKLGPDSFNSEWTNFRRKLITIVAYELIPN